MNEKIDVNKHDTAVASQQREKDMGNCFLMMCKEWMEVCAESVYSLMIKLYDK